MRGLLRWILGVALPIWLILTFLAVPEEVVGHSMEPTLHTGDRVIVFKLPRWLHAWGLDPHWLPAGSIAAFRPPAGSPYDLQRGLFGLSFHPYLIKRVVAIPGDTVAMRAGVLLRNGRPVHEAYTSEVQGASSFRPVHLGKGQYFLLGDNRALGASLDSRYFGPVPAQDIAGPVIFRFWPLSRWGPL
jgi:signal peptidase I